MAGATAVLPGWVAVMEQVPEATRVTAIPETVQTDGVVEAKLMGRPEVAVALKLKDGVPSNILPMVPNKMLCEVCATVKLWMTGAAAE